MVPTYAYIVVMLAIIGYGVARVAFGEVPPFVPPPGWDAGRAGRPGARPLPDPPGVQPGGRGTDRRRGDQRRRAGLQAAGVEERADDAHLGRDRVRASCSWESRTSSRRLGIQPDGSEQNTVLSLLVRTLDRRRVDPGRGAGGDGAHPRARGEHELRRLPAPQLVPRARRLPAAPVRVPRRAAGVHDRHRRAVAVAIALLIGFQASVSGLIPLYTLGVFIAFTLSQGGMLVRWWRRREDGWRAGLAINGARDGSPPRSSRSWSGRATSSRAPGW